MEHDIMMRTMVELADTLVEDFDVVDLLTILADRCVEALDVSAAGLLLASTGGDLRVVASSSEAMRVVELFELQGPKVRVGTATGPVCRSVRPASTRCGRRGRASPRW